VLTQTHQKYRLFLVVSDVAGILVSWLLAFYLRFHTSIIPVTKGIPRLEQYAGKPRRDGHRISPRIRSRIGGSQRVTAPVCIQAAAAQLVGSEVQLVELLPKLAVVLLQVQPVYQLLLPLQAAPIRLGLGRSK